MRRPDTYTDIDGPGFRIVDKRHPAPYVEAMGPPRIDLICREVDPEHRDRVDWCANAAGHDGLHNWEYCDHVDPASEYECQHACRRERDHEPPHRQVFEW